jgi:hypothetical protein
MLVTGEGAMAGSETHNVERALSSPLSRAERRACLQQLVDERDHVLHSHVVRTGRVALGTVGCEIEEGEGVGTGDEWRGEREADRPAVSRHWSDELLELWLGLVCARCAKSLFGFWNWKASSQSWKVEEEWNA